MEVLAKCVADPSLAIPYLLMASYLYYVRDEDTPMLDHEYDCLCVFALKNWDIIRHRHKWLVHKNALESGSLSYLGERDYPLITRSSAYQWKEGALPKSQYAQQLIRIANAVCQFVGGMPLSDLI